MGDDMSDKITKAIEQFKEENGNNNFTNKDLLIYLVKRIDDLPCEQHNVSIAKAITTLKNWKWFAGVLISLNFSIIGGMLWLIIEKI